MATAHKTRAPNVDSLRGISGTRTDSYKVRSNAQLAD